MSNKKIKNKKQKYQDTKIEVLGERFRVIYSGRSLPSDTEGLCDTHKKTITVRTEDRTNEEILGTLAHEWFHLFIHSSGLLTLDNDLEEVLAVQFERALPSLLAEIRRRKKR